MSARVRKGRLFRLFVLFFAALMIGAVALHSFVVFVVLVAAALFVDFLLR